MIEEKQKKSYDPFSRELMNLKILTNAQFAESEEPLGWGKPA
jgi:hypothetical protein